MSEVSKTIEILKNEYSTSTVLLKHSNNLELLIATILSAQTTDKQVNKITPTLFEKYAVAKDYANADIKELEALVKTCGFYHNKAKNIKKTGEILETEFKGVVPDNMNDLLKLAGVARKTANIVLWNAYGKTEGIAVDTHVKRISYRLGWTENTRPDIIEKDLMKIIPKKHWGNINHWLVQHGRKYCKAQKPRCLTCILTNSCIKKGVEIKFG